MALEQSSRPSAAAGSARALSVLWPGLLGGGVLALLEIALVLSHARDLFLSSVELTRYAALALSALPALGALLALAGAAGFALLARGGEPGAARHLQRVRIALFALAAPASAWALWLLTAGRRARALPARPLLVLLAAVAFGAALAFTVPALLRLRTAPARRRVPVALGLLALASAALVLDGLALRRLYPAFHFALALLALGFALGFAALIAPAAPAPRPRITRGGLAAAVVLALASVVSLARAPNARFAIREGAPFSGKLLELARRAGPTAAPPPAAKPAAVAHASALSGDLAGIDLRGRDVLLITVDALRADRLRAYGGSGLTPAMDALAQESVVFQSAYTPTPHTSYAVASLLTAKFIQPLFAMSEVTGDHATLPRLLRHHGYRTAAFYPPAIFFVDEGRFDWLHRDQLGFEYAKAMFATADDRVQQLQLYLNEVDAGHPLFVWVHLFEPHEPYDPQGVVPKDDSPRARYDAEVQVADLAIGRLRETFQRARPGATVILTADHGEEFGEHGGRHHGTTLFDEQVRVPLLWSSPGAARPRSVSAPVELVDLGTTLLSALGIPREARMRGDDLGPLLAGADDPPGLHAFASIDHARMVTDGRYKLICGDGECQLFDRLEDPGERRDLSQERPAELAALRAELSAFAASLPRIEALALRGGAAIPEALARARLGERAAGPELVPLLSHARADVRAAAARAIGELQVASARQVLSTLRLRDTEVDVRAQAAIAALRLGDAAAQEQVRGLLSSPARELGRSAALALAARDDGAGEAILLEAAADHALAEPERLAAIVALAAIGSGTVSQALLPLLADVRLRPTVARALAAIGDARAAPALARALAGERYPEARTAEAAALLELAARAPRGGAAIRRKALAQIWRFLGTDSGLPNGVELLLQAGELSRASGAGAELIGAPSVRHGEWVCGERGCRPLAAAAIALPARGAPRGPARITLRVEAEAGGGTLTLDQRPFAVVKGGSEISLALPEGRLPPLAVAADAHTWLRAIVVAEQVPDVLAPAAEEPPQALAADEHAGTVAP